MENWRIIDSGPGGAAWNMALDEALLIAAGKGISPPTLRFFSWEKPSLSIGSFQKADELDLERIRETGTPLVRRPTGGRAVLHDAELTYSVSCPINSPFFPPDLLGSYKVIGACFLKGLAELGVKAELVPVKKGPQAKQRPGRNPLCFSSPSWYEVLLGGKKLIGSAQRRLKDSFLQQGSLLIELDIPGLLSFMNFADDVARERAHEALSGKMTALGERHKGTNLEELKAALIKGFQKEMRAEFAPGTLTPEELATAESLCAVKYSRESWNLYRK